MRATIPDIHPDARLNASEASRALGISRETFRQYVLAGRIRKRYRKNSTRPYYRGKDILCLWRY